MKIFCFLACQSLRMQCVCVVWGCARPANTAVCGLFCCFASVQQQVRDRHGIERNSTALGCCPISSDTYFPLQTTHYVCSHSVTSSTAGLLHPPLMFIHMKSYFVFETRLDCLASLRFVNLPVLISGLMSDSLSLRWHSHSLRYHSL